MQKKKKKNLGPIHKKKKFNRKCPQGSTHIGITRQRLTVLTILKKEKKKRKRKPYGQRVNGN